MTIVDRIKNDKEIQELKKIHIEKYGKNLPYNYDQYNNLEDYKKKLREKCK
jgi:hypothetical protein